MTEEVFGTQSNPTLPLQGAIDLYVSQHPRGADAKLQVGLMSMDDSKLTSKLFPCESERLLVDRGSYQLRRFSLGSQQTPEQAAQRLFEGLRALDEGEEGDKTTRCVVIFVEALSDDAGVGLAIMNRLQKAAGSVIHVEL